MPLLKICQPDYIYLDYFWLVYSVPFAWITGFMPVLSCRLQWLCKNTLNDKVECLQFCFSFPLCLWTCKVLWFHTSFQKFFYVLLHTYITCVCHIDICKIYLFQVLMRHICTMHKMIIIIKLFVCDIWKFWAHISMWGWNGVMLCGVSKFWSVTPQYDDCTQGTVYLIVEEGRS